MSLLKNAITNRRKRRESLGKGSSNLLSILNNIIKPPVDTLQEPSYGLGYKSPQSKVIYLSRGKLVVGVKGIRAFWAYLYGINPSGSPKGISTLLESINTIKSDKTIKGWSVLSSSSNSHSKYKALFIHKPKCIKILTNDVEGLKAILKEANPTDWSSWRVLYKDLTL